MKNIVYQVTWKNMKMNKRRTWTTFLGIFFMVLLITCVFAGRKTAVSYLQDVGSQVEGKWHVAVYDVSKQQFDALDRLDYVKQWGRSADNGYVDFPASANSQTPYLYVKAYEEPCFDWMNIKLKEGRLPEKPGELVISQKALKDGAEVKPGDTVNAEYFERTITGLKKGGATVFPFQQIEVQGGETRKLSQDFPFYENNDSFRIDKNYTGEKETLTVVGIIDSPWFEQEGAAGYLAFTCYDGGRTGGFNAAGILDLKGKYEGMGIYQEIRDIMGDKKVEFNDYVLSFTGDSSDSVVNFMVQIMTVFFLVLIVTAAIILIYNVFNISFEERSRYLGMLCSVGATGRQKRSSVYFEAFSLFLLALPLGTGAGCLVVLGGMNLLEPLIYALVSSMAVIPEKVPVHLVISGQDLIFIAVSSGLTVLVSAILPAAKISRVGPIECIRGNLGKNQGAGKRRAESSLKMGAVRMLAKNSLGYQKRKTRGMTRAAAIFMIILIVTTATSKTLTTLISYRLQDSEMMSSDSAGWDYQFLYYNGNDMEEYQKIRDEIVADASVEAFREEYTGIFLGKIPREALSSEYQDAIHRIFNLYYHRELTEEEFRDEYDNPTGVLNLIAVDEETFEGIARATDTDQKLLEGDTPGAIIVQSGEVSTSNWSISGMEPEKYEFMEIDRMTDMKQGEILPMTMYSEAAEKEVEFPLRIAGFGTNEQLKDYFTFHSQEMWAIVSLNTGREINALLSESGDADGESSGNHMEPVLYLRLNDKDTGLIKKLNALARADDMHYAFGPADVTGTLNQSLCGIIRILLFCFVLLTSVICLLNLYNSVHGWVAEQRRYFAMLVSVGAEQAQIRKMLLHETLHILVRSCVWTVAIATLLIRGIEKFLVERFGKVSLAFPWRIYVTAIFITAIVIFGFMMYHYHREKDNDLRTVLMV